MTVCYQDFFNIITNLQVSGGLSAHHQEILAVHQLWYILCGFDDRVLPEVGRNCVPSYSTIHHLMG